MLKNRKRTKQNLLVLLVATLLTGVLALFGDVNFVDSVLGVLNHI